MYQRDNSQERQTENEKEKERNDGEAEADRQTDRQREGRGHTEPTGGGLRPETALSRMHSHTVSLHKYVLGVYVER